MDGNLEIFKKELFDYAKEIMQKHRIFPYVAMVTKEGKVIAKGHNMATKAELLYSGDITQQGDVMAVRNAQAILKSGNLENNTLISFMEPTILGFDVALWSGIKDFIWFINKSSAPEHYTDINYSPLEYSKKHSDITIKAGIFEDEALELINLARKKRYYPLISQPIQNPS